jgi:hypothetical protein
VNVVSSTLPWSLYQGRVQKFWALRQKEKVALEIYVNHQWYKEDASNCYTQILVQKWLFLLTSIG